MEIKSKSLIIPIGFVVAIISLAFTAVQRGSEIRELEQENKELFYSLSDCLGDSKKLEGDKEKIIVEQKADLDRCYGFLQDYIGKSLEIKDNR